MGIVLPVPPDPVGSYVTCVTVGDLAFLAAHGPWKDGELVLKGKVGSDLDLPAAQQAATIVTVNLLGTLKQALGSLSAVRRVVRVGVMVNAVPSFTEHHRVADAASDLLVDVFGPEAGPHTRTALGVDGLPFDVSVVIEGVVAISPAP
jgi:enamine deaminase RidA (YjgF/YER057c/UK114 family)